MSAYIDKSFASESKTSVGFNGDFLAIAFRIAAVFSAQFVAGTILPELEIYHAGYGVGTVLGGGAVPERFHGLQRNGRNTAHVGAVRAKAAKLHQGGAMAALAVDEHQGMV